MERTTVSEWLAAFDRLIGDLAMSEHLHPVQKEHVAERAIEALSAVTRPGRADLDR